MCARAHAHTRVAPLALRQGFIQTNPEELQRREICLADRTMLFQLMLICEGALDWVVSTAGCCLDECEESKTYRL